MDSEAVEKVVQTGKPERFRPICSTCGAYFDDVVLPPEKVEQVREALEELEWSGARRGHMKTCPYCGGKRRDGHADFCKLSAALAVLEEKP